MPTNKITPAGQQAQSEQALAKALINVHTTIIDLVTDIENQKKY